MFEIITSKFLYKAHDAFKELRYTVTDAHKLSYYNFYMSAVNTLNHTDTLLDALNCVDNIQFCNREWDKIEKAISKKNSEWKHISFNGKKDITLVDDEEADGSFFITNGIHKNKLKDVYISSVALGKELHQLTRKGDKYALIDDYDYYITNAITSSSKMKLYDKYNNLIAVIVLSDEEIHLEKNKTKIDIVTYDGCTMVLSKTYSDSLKGNYEKIENDKIMATIQWGILDSNDEAGLAKVINYEEDTDLDLVLTIATSTFILHKRQMDAIKRSERMLFLSNRRMMELNK